MNVEDITARVEAIRAKVDNPHWDPEAAHGMEDALHVDALKAIANGAPDPVLLASAALGTLEIDYPKWCA